MYIWIYYLAACMSFQEWNHYEHLKNMLEFESTSFDISLLVNLAERRLRFKQSFNQNYFDRFLEIPKYCPI